MTDNNKERTIQDILNDEIERKLAENPPEVPTLEEFKTMAYERLKEKDDRTVVSCSKTNKKRKLCIAGAAAGFIVAVIIGAFALNMFTADVGADKNPKEEIITEDGVIIEDGGYGSSVGEENVWVTEDWEHVKDGKTITKDLLMPQYIPIGYEFAKLTIEPIVDDDFLCEYLFLKDDGNILEMEIMIMRGGEVAFLANDVDRTLESIKGKVYVQDRHKNATIYIDGGITISIWGDISDEEIIKMIEGMSY